MITGADGRRVGRRRNLPAKPFVDFVARLAHDAVRNGAHRLDLVLAGDVFDIHRSGLWFHPAGGPMPYHPMSAALEAKVLQILNAIEAQNQQPGPDDEPGVHAVLAVFRKLGAEQKYFDGEKDVAFPRPVTIHYLPGNHDRLCNATERIRARVREILGMQGGGARFDNQILMPDPPVLIRHGHEYEFANFSVDNTRLKPFPVRLPPEHYDAPAFGDFITVQIASRLPVLFRERHGDAKILGTPLLAHVYDRLIEFDDVRPQSALFAFILSDPDVHDRDAAWDAIEPLLREILTDLRDDEFFRKALKQRDKPWQPDVIDAVQALLDVKAWKVTHELPAGLVKWIADHAHGKPGKPPVDYASREEAIIDGRARLLIAGHTHNPVVELAASDPQHGERYYVDTGTWRNRVPSTPDGKGFGHLKALTYVTVYASDEDLGSGVADPRGPADSASGAVAGGRLFSFDYWSGVTQRFVR